MNSRDINKHRPVQALWHSSQVREICAFAYTTSSGEPQTDERGGGGMKDDSNTTGGNA